MTQIEEFLKFAPNTIWKVDYSQLDHGAIYVISTDGDGHKNKIIVDLDGKSADEKNAEFIVSASAIVDELRNLLLTLDKAREALATCGSNKGFMNDEQRFNCDKVGEAITAIEKFNPAIQLVKEGV